MSGTGGIQYCLLSLSSLLVCPEFVRSQTKDSVQHSRRDRSNRVTSSSNAFHRLQLSIKRSTGLGSDRTLSSTSMSSLRFAASARRRHVQTRVNRILERIYMRERLQHPCCDVFAHAGKGARRAMTRVAIGLERMSARWCNTPEVRGRSRWKLMMRSTGSTVEG